MYVIDLTTNSVMSWISSDEDSPLGRRILWLPADRTNAAAFLHFFGEAAVSRAMKIATLQEPEHSIIAVEVRQFLVDRANGVYDKPERRSQGGHYLLEQNDYDQAYSEGVVAGSAGRPQAANPYQITNLKGIGWLNGWVEGARLLRGVGQLNLGGVAP